MAGHSKWANIQHRKGAQDKKRGKIFTKLIREVGSAARAGADPGMNPRLRLAIDKARGANGVQVAGIVEDTSPGRRIYDPGHPDADAQGYVTMPNVDSVTEMVNLIDSSRSYEANVTAMQTAKTMFSRTLDILK